MRINLKKDNLIKKLAVMAMAGIIGIGTCVMACPLNVECAIAYGLSTGYDEATGHYVISATDSGVYASQNADKIATSLHSIFQYYDSLNFTEKGLVNHAEVVNNLLITGETETSVFSTIAAMYGDDGVNLYLKCAQVGCFTDFYDYVGTTEYKSRCKDGYITASSCVSAERYIKDIVGSYGTMQQAHDAMVKAGYTDIETYACAIEVKMANTYNPADTKHATTKGTSGTTAATASTTDADFDATFYATLYPDVKAAFGTDAAALYNHYVKYGKAEGRFKNATEYNAALAAANK